MIRKTLENDGDLPIRVAAAPALAAHGAGMNDGDVDETELRGDILNAIALDGRIEEQLAFVWRQLPIAAPIISAFTPDQLVTVGLQNLPHEVMLHTNLHAHMMRDMPIDSFPIGKPSIFRDAIKSPLA